NHWWNVPLYVTARGLTTSLIPHPTGPGFQIDFDLCSHQLEILSVTGSKRSFQLESQPVAAFFAQLMAALDELGVGTPIWPVPVEIEGALPFRTDRVHDTYDPDHAHRFWLLLVEAQRVFVEFRGQFLGKASPVHLFWGALDLAVTRFSGRPAPPYTGHVPNCGPHVMHEAYSHEVSSSGYWPGGEGGGLFYSYAYPEPATFRDCRVTPDESSYNEALGEFVLPYDVVRTAADPDAVLLGFLQSTYEAAAERGGWDRKALERPSGSPTA
ncbi:MAG: DUF5996 family protein, partial [Mycobacterium sp.]